jgi:hypothetical protein
MSVALGKCRVLFAGILVACIMAIVISPLVDLPVTTLRARQIAFSSQLALVLLATLLSGFHVYTWDLTWTPRAFPPPASASPDVTCSWLC